MTQSTVNTVFESNLQSGELLFRGKVRDVYDLGDAMCLVASDRLSAFDVVLPLPFQGKDVFSIKCPDSGLTRPRMSLNHILDVDFAST